MTLKGLGEMFEGDFSDMCAGTFWFMSMGGRAEGLACADLGARTPIGVMEISFRNFTFNEQHRPRQTSVYCFVQTGSLVFVQLRSLNSRHFFPK